MPTPNDNSNNFSPVWLNRFLGFLRKEVILFDQAVVQAIQSDFPSTEDLTATMVQVNSSVSFSSTVTIL